jgi:acetyltransferase-like isoleucine patch superfamily enzyme
MIMRGLMDKVIEEIFHTYRSCLHMLAMGIPNSHLKRFFYRLRGSKIGKNVDIANFVFLEDAFPELITIGDNVDIAPWVTIATHDSVLVCLQRKLSVRTGEVIIKNNVYIGTGVIILPGVTIGEYSVIGAGAVVIHDIPPFSVAYGVPAKVHCTVDDWLKKNGEVR